MKASDLFLKCLENQGVTTIFGVPGEENSDIMISLLNSSIQFVTCRHEQTAAFMADMYGRITGKPGVCLATLGPGATNLITGVANANMDNVPLVAILGQTNTNLLHKESHQNMDAVSMYKPVTKWSTSIRDPEVIPEIICKGFNLAQTGRAGAVAIELPEDIARLETNSSLPVTKSIYEYSHSMIDIDHTLQLIEECQKPLLLLGAGCARESCAVELLEFITKTNIYAVTTFMGKGVISDRLPFSLYCIGLSMKDIALEAFSQADLVICIGYHMVESAPVYWNIGQTKKIIHIDAAASDIDEKYLPDIELVGKIKNILQELNIKLSAKHKKDKTLFADIRKKIIADLQINITDDSFPIKPQRVLHDLRTVLRDEDILISDVGAHKIWVARQYPTYQAQSCFIYNGFCSMGGALPGAITAKWLYPEKNVIALCGDGGFMMSIQAIVTAVQYKTPIIIIIWQDNYYGLTKWKQEISYHTFSHVELANPDLVKVAQSFGCNAIKIAQAADLTPTLKTAFNEKEKPTVIVITIDYSENMKLTKRLGEIVAH
jgi:acetolactate synthase-1/2/3 large subunit